MNVQIYLFFDGCCEEAVEFYRRSLGAEVNKLLRYKDSPQPPPPDKVTPGSDDKIMHAELRVGDTFIMASDGCNAGTPSFQGFSLSLAASDATEAKRLFDALADGGQVRMPLGPTFWSPCFGMVADRFGVGWMVNALT